MVLWPLLGQLCSYCSVMEIGKSVVESGIMYLYGVKTQMTTVLTYCAAVLSETCNRQWWPNTCQYVSPVALLINPGIVLALVMLRWQGGELSLLY